jgi:hypothetical protein
MSIIEQIEAGTHDAELGDIALALDTRRRRIRMLRNTPMTERFIETVRDHPGCTAQELAVLLNVTPSRIYQLAKTATDAVAQVGQYPTRFSLWTG